MVSRAPADDLATPLTRQVLDDDDAEVQVGGTEKRRRWHERRPLLFAALTGVVFAALSSTATAMFILYAVRQPESKANVLIPKCVDCRSHPLDGTFVGLGEMDITIVGVELSLIHI